MKHYVLLLALSLLLGVCHAQGYIDHIVQRGETLDFLATKFGVTEQDIRDQNEDFDLDVLYVGLPLQIPIPEIGDSPEEIERIVASRASTSSVLYEANLSFNNGYYKKAAKLYTAALKENETSDIYYLRGRCYLHQGKYKSAIKDLEMANRGSDLSNSLKTSCKSLLAEAHKKRDAQLEARSEAWNQVFALAAMTTAVVLDAKMTSSASTSYSGTSTDSYSGGSTTSYESSSNSSSSSSNTSNSTSTRQCPSCQSLKHCTQCRGTGNRTDNMFGTGQDPTKKCGICGGSGVCQRCKGTGTI